MKRIILIITIIIILFILKVSVSSSETVRNSIATRDIWPIRSIDTMKLSRDRARAELANPAFDTVITKDLQTIKEMGANYVAIGTPYDNEFLPYLTRWVTAARKVGLNVWFRGNWSS